jgi:sugar phosphate isomerase/epimerase
MLSINTDYVSGTGCAEPHLRRIAEAGFRHIHWCHHWSSDFLYTDPEIDQIAAWLKEYDLALLDLHASAGVEKNWVSAREYERLAGVELVRNRIAMTARLGADVVVMHLPSQPNAEGDARDAFWRRAFASLDALQPFARSHGVRIALENMIEGDTFGTISRTFDRYDEDFVGLCYDSGHGNLRPDGLDELDRLKDRLIATHLHDNDGSGDQHRLLYSGAIDWPRLARIVARSAYRKPITMEVLMDKGELENERAFLERARETGTRFARTVQACRSQN